MQGTDRTLVHPPIVNPRATGPTPGFSSPQRDEFAEVEPVYPDITAEHRKARELGKPLGLDDHTYLLLNRAAQATVYYLHAHQQHWTEVARTESRLYERIECFVEACYLVSPAISGGDDHAEWFVRIRKAVHDLVEFCLTPIEG